MREIGSEFWIQRDPSPLSTVRDGIYTVSGRTAIDLIIQDITKTRQVRNVFMPAWCCDSMIAPFQERGIDVRFCDVELNADNDKSVESVVNNKTNTDCTDDTDILYVTNYFGYENTIDLNVVRQFKAKGAITLYDRTHSFLMEEDPYLALADYSFASIRKWMGVIGGAVVDGVKDPHLKPYPHLDCKEKAMRMKRAFIEGDDNIDKQAFLNLYSEFGHHLAEDYRNYAMDDLSYAIYKATDIEAVKAQRRANAQYLHEHLKSVRFMYNLTDKAVPLFVPVQLENKEQRDAVRRKLFESEIYCPIHWPRPAQIPVDFDANKFYDTELSLICDQRYATSDMQRMVDLINGFMEVLQWKGKNC